MFAAESWAEEVIKALIASIDQKKYKISLQ